MALRASIGFATLGLIALGALFWAYRTPASQGQPAEGPVTVIGTFGGVSLTMELATTTAAQALGLGGRASLPADHGMLFVFPEAGYYGFWMKDTLIPLDMFWLDASGRVVFFLKDIEPQTYPETFYPTSPARYVLETNAGFADAHAVATGTPLRLQNSPLISE